MSEKLLMVHIQTRLQALLKRSNVKKMVMVISDHSFPVLSNVRFTCYVSPKSILELHAHFLNIAIQPTDAMNLNLKEVDMRFLAKELSTTFCYLNRQELSQGMHDFFLLDLSSGDLIITKEEFYFNEENDPWCNTDQVLNDFFYGATK